MAVSREYVAALNAVIDTIVRQALVVDLDLLDTVIAESSLFDSIGPIVDPTAWMQHGDAVRLAEKTQRAFRTFRAEIEALRETPEYRNITRSWERRSGESNPLEIEGVEKEGS